MIFKFGTKEIQELITESRLDIEMLQERQKPITVVILNETFKINAQRQVAKAICEDVGNGSQIYLVEGNQKFDDELYQKEKAIAEKNFAAYARMYPESGERFLPYAALTAYFKLLVKHDNAAVVVALGDSVTRTKIAAINYNGMHGITPVFVS